MAKAKAPVARTWFRAYNDIISDKKLRRIAQESGCQPAIVYGVYVGLMCLANESHIRGELWFSEDIPYEMHELPDAIGVDAQTLATLMQGFQKYGQVHIELDGVITLPKFTRRQYDSDSSTERVRSFRERHKDDPETKMETVTETLQERSGNGSDQIRTEHIKSEEKRDDHDVPPVAATTTEDACYAVAGTWVNEEVVRRINQLVQQGVTAEMVFEAQARTVAEAKRQQDRGLAHPGKRQWGYVLKVLCTIQEEARAGQIISGGGGLHPTCEFVGLEGSA